MWNKSNEVPKIKALRRAAAMAAGQAGCDPASACNLTLELVIHADVSGGDLDNFVAGVCDALMPAHERTPIDQRAWADLPEDARPDKAIAWHDDSVIRKIGAERRPGNRRELYSVSISR